MFYVLKFIIYLLVFLLLFVVVSFFRNNVNIRSSRNESSISSVGEGGSIFELDFKCAGGSISLHLDVKHTLKWKMNGNLFSHCSRILRKTATCNVVQKF